MKLEKTVQDDHQAQVIVDVEPDRLEAARRRAARKLAERGKIPGFRPGKAPYEVILRYYGDAAVFEQAVDLLVDELYPEMLKEAAIEPAAAGSLEKIDGTDLPRLTFKVPLRPEVSLGNYANIRLPYEFESPGPEKLEQALEELQQMYGTTETVDREIQEGDYVLVDLKSEKESLTRPGFATLLRREDRSDEFPYPGFARELIGLKVADVKTLSHEFPADFPDQSLAGQTVGMEATIKTVRSMKLPPIDDEFAKMVGKYESLQALKDVLARDIEARARVDYDDDYYARLVDKIKEGATIKYAAQTLDHEAEHVVEDMRQRLAQQGLDLETYYKMRKTDATRFLEEEAKPVARKRLERSLILDEVSRQEKIDVDNESLDQEFNSTLVDLQAQGLNLSSVRGGKQGQQRVAEAVAMESASRLLTRRTLERLKAIATGVRQASDKEAADEANGEIVTAEGGNSVVAKAGMPHRRTSKTRQSGTSKKASTGAKSRSKSK